MASPPATAWRPCCGPQSRTRQRGEWEGKGRHSVKPHGQLFCFDCYVVARFLNSYPPSYFFWSVINIIVMLGLQRARPRGHVAWLGHGP